MIAVLSDTHGETGTRLSGRAREAVDQARLVVHAGDFTTTAVLDAFEAEIERLYAVYGNVDAAGVRDRLPVVRTFEEAGARFVLVHGHEHGETARAMLGRQEGADVVVSGHSHAPGVVRTDGPLLLNPGSHAQPRRWRAAHAELEPREGGLVGRLVDREGTAFEEFEVGAPRP